MNRAVTKWYEDIAGRMSVIEDLEKITEGNCKIWVI